MLSPFISYSTDSLSVSSGNPYLKPEKNTTIELNYTYKKKETFLSPSLYYTYQTDIIGLRPAVTENQTLMEKWDNTFRAQRLGAHLYGQTTILEFIVFGIYLDGWYQAFDDKQYNGWSYQASLELEISLPWDIVLAASATFTGKNMQFNGYEYQSPLIDEISIVKNIFNNHGSIAISVINPFLKDYNSEIRWNHTFREESFAEHPDSFFGMIRFNYFFNKGKKINQPNKELLMEHDEK
jgi:hypothetical protein